MAQLAYINHEIGNLTEYSSTAVGAGQSLSATTASAMNKTKYGLAVGITTQNEVYGVKSGFANTSGIIRARFYIDPNSLTMATNDAFSILRTYNNSGTLAGITAQLRWSGTSYQFQIGIIDDSGGYYTSWNNITDAPHYITVRCVRASSATASDGYMIFTIDGVLDLGAMSVRNVDIYDAFTSFNSIRFGAVASIDAGTSGTFYLDELVVRDDLEEIDLVFDIQHEKGDLSEYDFTIIDSGDLSVTRAAARAFDGNGAGNIKNHGNNYGLSFLLDDTNVLGVYKSCTNKYFPDLRARFHLDINSLSVAEGDQFTICLIHIDRPDATGAAYQGDGANTVTITVNAHGLINGMPWEVSSPSSEAGLATGNYVISNVATNTFDVTFANDGSAGIHNGRVPIYILAYINLRYTAATGYQLALWTLDDLNNSSSNYQAITDAPHTIEIHCVRASASGVSDGTIKIYVDGAELNSITSLDNWHMFVDLDYVALGAGLWSDIAVGTTGTFYLDNFKITKSSTAIGQSRARRLF